MTKPLVLLSNDDGYRSPGLQRLRTALQSIAEVIVCAPDTEQSAASHSLSLHRPLRLFAHGDGVFSVDGTPADSVYVALHGENRVLPRRPDAVVSGINLGVNLGDDVFYSGTVAAAREGALKGVPSIALSAALDAESEAASRLGAELVQALLDQAKGTAVLFNVNIPPGSGWQLRATRLGARIYQDEVDFRRDPRGREYLWIGGPGAEHRAIAGSDTEAYDQGVVGVTPLVLDLWARDAQEAAEAVVKALPQSP